MGFKPFARSVIALMMTLWFTACATESTTKEPLAKFKGEAPSPTAAPIIISKGLQGSTQILANDPDEEDTHRFVLATDAEHGKAYLGTEGLAVYIPEPEYVGHDRFQVLVEDSRGVTATTWVPVVVRLAPQYATATADIVTYKNTPGAYVVYAESGVASAFQVVSVPEHGTVAIDANGFLTYTPDEGYTGADAVDVQVVLAGGAIAEVTVTVQVVNRPPVPAASGIHTETGLPGSTLIHAGDPDPRETVHYQIAEPPSLGSATVDPHGKVTYYPGQLFGEDSLVVRVVDGSGAAATLPVNVTVRLPSDLALRGEGGFSEEICNDGLDRVLIQHIDPPPGTDIREIGHVSARLAYSLAATAEVGLGDAFANPITTVTVAPGCGVVTVSTQLTPEPGELWTAITPLPFRNQQTVVYPFSGVGTLVPSGYYSTQPLGGPVIEYYASFEETVNAIYQVTYMESAGSMVARANFRRQFSPVFRVETPNACGKAYTTLQTAHGLLEMAPLMVGVVNTPPRISIDRLLTGIPLTPGQTYTLPVELESCGAPLTVTLTTEPWFSLSATTVTLQPRASVDVVIHADALPAAGRLIEGGLRVHPVDASFADILVPVSAIQIQDIDLEAYSFKPITSTPPISFGSAEFALPWPFPFAGVTFTTIVVWEDGSLCGVPAGTDCSFIGTPMLGGLATYPMVQEQGMRLFPYWATQRHTHTIPGENASGLYSRTVTTGAEPRFELLWWDVQTGLSDQNHNVFRATFYPDGRFTFDYPFVQPTGIEFAAWWNLFLESQFERVGLDIRSGDVYRFGPVH